MSETLLVGITVFILAVFVGIEVIGRVPATLHTPLMSGTNAIHGIVLVGAMLVAFVATDPLLIGFCRRHPGDDQRRRRLRRHRPHVANVQEAHASGRRQVVRC